MQPAAQYPDDSRPSKSKRSLENRASMGCTATVSARREETSRRVRHYHPGTVLALRRTKQTSSRIQFSGESRCPPLADGSQSTDQEAIVSARHLEAGGPRS